MFVYLTLIVTSVLAGLAAVLLYGRKDKLDPKIFLAGVLLNLGALLGIVWCQRRRQQ